jgi:phosphoadenosine phosphosulfate reductase
MQDQQVRRHSQRIMAYRNSLQAFSEEFSAEEVVRWAVQAFGDGIVLQTSAGIQAAVMLKLVTRIKHDVKVVFVDTGYLPQETVDYMEILTKELRLNLVVARPQLTPEQIETRYGKLWETDHELYGEITKVEPMNRALRELGCVAILSGLRSEQTSNRSALKKLSYEVNTERYKVLPILDWTKVDVQTYMKEMRLPRHPLETAGFTTIGDKHSSRALKEGETNERASRFGGKVQECGLHTSTASLDNLLAQLKDHTLPDGYVLFTKPNCKFCKAAKALLKDRGVAYIENDVSDEVLAAEMHQHAPDAKTVPQIFSDGTLVGGFTELFSSLDIPGSAEDYVKQFVEKKPKSETSGETKFADKKPKFGQFADKKPKFGQDSTHRSSGETKVWNQILQGMGWDSKIKPPTYYAEAMIGSAALLSVAGIVGPMLLQRGPADLQSNSKLLESSAKLMESSARLMSDSRLVDSYSRMVESYSRLLVRS